MAVDSTGECNTLLLTQDLVCHIHRLNPQLIAAFRAVPTYQEVLQESSKDPCSLHRSPTTLGCGSAARSNEVDGHSFSNGRRNVLVVT